jgi:non-lysosomal glucosylceramidase
VSLGGRGNLQDWEIFNRPAKGFNLPCTFFALRTATASGEVVTRVLERRLLPPFSRARGLRPIQVAGLPRLSEARFTGEYPIATIRFDDDDVPLEITLEAFNPMVPHDAACSGLPVAIFLWRLRNRNDSPVDLTLAFSVTNPIGAVATGTVDIDTDELSMLLSGPSLGGNLSQWCEDRGVRGLRLGSTSISPASVGAGTMAVATSWPETTFLERWERAGWYDPLESFWEVFRSTGRFADQRAYDPSPQGRSDVSTLGLCASLAPGEAVTLPVVLTWHFPNLVNYWDTESPALGARLGNWYACQHEDAWAVAVEALGRLDELVTRTWTFRDTLFASTLPEVVLDALSSQMSTLRTATCLRTEDGAFHAFEGCNDTEGSCPMDCTHVWNYEQTLAHLFPALERSMRETDFLVSTRPDGNMAFRSILPTSLGERWEYLPSADGQLGCILKLYREWQLCGDTDWLRSLWPQAKRALEWSWRGGLWDADRDGVLEGEQHVTYDIELFGPNTMTGTLYLGALKAAARMAEELGDREASDLYRSLLRQGAEKLDALLWNGAYYEQRVPQSISQTLRERPAWNPTPLHPGEDQPRYQYGSGCLSDQLLGQWFCHVVGLGYILPEAHVRSAVSAVFRHNWRDDLSRHENCQRTFALNDEAGLLLCTWPREGRPRYPFPYADEVWTGVEYQVAAHLVYEGLVAEALAVVEGVRARHDGVRRNPWDEFECGHHYARALASWSLLLALSGYRFSAVEQRLRFDPALDLDPFRCFFSTAEAWGSYEQRSEGESQVHSLHVVEGELTLEVLEVPVRAPERRTAAIELGGLTLAPGERLVANVSAGGSFSTSIVRGEPR